MSEDGVKKSADPRVSLVTGCIAGKKTTLFHSVNLCFITNIKIIDFIYLGAIECISVWPMEYIKTQLQLQKVIPGQAPPFTGVVSGLVYTVRTTGFFSLYNGSSYLNIEIYL